MHLPIMLLPLDFLVLVMYGMLLCNQLVEPLDLAEQISASGNANVDPAFKMNCFSKVNCVQ